MVTKNLVAAQEAKFLSDVLREIPSHCLFNKGITGCGGTTLEIESERDSIILVPNINLVLNKMDAYKTLAGLYGEITRLQFISKLDKQRKYKKIIATYDSLPKLIDWLGPEIFKKYFLLIDEYHILFNSYALRYEAISAVLTYFKRFDNYCFMTATPLEEDNILEEIKDLDRITITWPQAVKVKAIVEDVFFTSKRVNELIDIALKADYNLHIFINSINTIRAIIKSIGTKDFRTICSKNAKREDMRLGGKLQVQSITSPVRKINFYTATAFEGVDIYDSVGKTIVVSDTNISQSLVDISTLFIQICGRLRDSIYKDQVTFVVNTNGHRYLKYKNEQDFKNYSKVTADKAKSYEIDFVKHSVDSKEIEVGSYDNNCIYYQSKYIGLKESKLFFDPNLQKIDIQNYKIVTDFFSNSLSVINNLNKTNRVESESVETAIFREIYNTLPNK